MNNHQKRHTHLTTQLVLSFLLLNITALLNILVPNQLSQLFGIIVLVLLTIQVYSQRSIILTQIEVLCRKTTHPQISLTVLTLIELLLLLGTSLIIYLFQSISYFYIVIACVLAILTVFSYKLNKRLLEIQPTILTKPTKFKNFCHKYSSWFTGLILCIILLGGLLLRLHQLGTLSFWLDEIFTATVVRTILNNGIPKLPSGFFYQRGLIFSYVTALFAHLWGENEFIIRLPSVIFGTLTIIVAYFVGKELQDEKVGVLTAFFTAFLAWQIEFSRFARMYQLLQLVFSLGILFFIKGFIQKRTIYKYFWAFTFGVALFTHQQGILLIPPLLIPLLIHKQDFIKNKTNWFIGLIVLMLLFIRFYIVDVTLAGDLKELIGVNSIQVKRLDVFNIYGLIHYYLISFPIFWISIISLITSTLCKTTQQLSKRSFVLATYIFTIMFGIIFMQTFGDKTQPRYLYTFNILFYACGIGGTINLLQHIFSNLKPSKNIKFVTVLSTTFILLFLIIKSFDSRYILFRDLGGIGYNNPTYAISTIYEYYPDYKNPIQYVQQNKTENDIIISTGYLYDIYYGEKYDYWLTEIDLPIYVHLITTENYEQKVISHYTGTPVINNLPQLENIIQTNIQQNRNVWIIVDDIYHLRSNTENYLKQHSNRVTYKSPDTHGKVYLFETQDQPH